jgi:Amt family ammonium transporter
VTENLNQWYAAGDQAYILVASAMVLVMIPGLAFLYSGLARRKSALSMIWACMFSASVITFQWYFWGYSLAFGPSTNGFIGNLDKFGLKGVLAAPSPGSPLIPELLYSFYQVRLSRTCSQHILTHSRCNSALSPLPLSSVALLNAVA